MPRSPRYPARSLGFSAKQPAPGSLTVLRHLARDGGLTEVPAVATIWRILSRRGFITPQPHKRPRSAWKRFCAQQPNELWQADVTHWHLADATEVEILNLLDDHSRLQPTRRNRQHLSTTHDCWARHDVGLKLVIATACRMTGSFRGRRRAMATRWMETETARPRSGRELGDAWVYAQGGRRKGTRCSQRSDFKPWV
jgi:hypothetical protein